MTGGIPLANNFDVKTNKVLDIRCAGLSSDTSSLTYKPTGLLRYHTDTDNWVYYNGTNFTELVEQNLKDLSNIIYTDGTNVGIGTTTPSQKLEVSGNILSTGTITGNNLAINNNVIYTNGNNVGIGTTTASEKLEVSGNINVDGTFISINNSSNPRLELNTLYEEARLYIEPSEKDFILSMDEPSNTCGISFRVGPQINSKVMRLTYGGNVGVGTTNPTEKLDVNGSVKFSSTMTVGTNPNTGTDGQFLISKGTNPMEWETIQTGTYPKESTNTLFVDNVNLRVGVGTTTPSEKLEVSGNILSTGTIRGNNLAINNNVIYTNGNNVGIGTTTASEKLEVSGNIKASGTLECASGLLVRNNGSNTIGILNTNFTNQDVYAFISQDSSGNVKIDASILIEFQIDNVTRMILNNGDVGIGITAPKTLLDVNGTQDSYLSRFKQTGAGLDDDCNVLIQTTFIGGEPSLQLLTGESGNSGAFQWLIQNFSQHLEFRYNTTNFNYNTGTLAGYIDNKADSASLNFTGQHRTFIQDIPFSNAKSVEGLIVCSNKNSYIKMSGGIDFGKSAITINESLPVVSLSQKSMDKSCFGVVSLAEDPETRQDQYGSFVSINTKENGDTRVYINSVGEGAIWVTNINGNLEAGDYITTSELPGYGMKQNDDLLHNYTVAKITMDCNFNPQFVPKRQIKKENGTICYYYKLKEIEFNEYESLPEKNKKVENITITQEEYDNLSQKEQDKYTNLSKNVYYYYKTSQTPKEGYLKAEEQSVVNVLDSYGQFVTEETGEYEYEYSLRYLDPYGSIITKEEYDINGGYIAAFVGCTYHCG